MRKQKAQSFFNLNIRLGKDKLDNFLTAKTNCTGCESTYIGKSSCILKESVGEHKGDVRNNRECSALALHCMDTQHQIDFEKVQI